MFVYLQKQEAKKSSYYETLNLEAKRLLLDAQNAIDNEADLDVISKMAEDLEIKLPAKENKKLP